MDVVKNSDRRVGDLLAEAFVRDCRGQSETVGDEWTAPQDIFNGKSLADLEATSHEQAKHFRRGFK